MLYVQYDIYRGLLCGDSNQTGAFPDEPCGTLIVPVLVTNRQPVEDVSTETPVGHRAIQEGGESFGDGRHRLILFPPSLPWTINSSREWKLPRCSSSCTSRAVSGLSSTVIPERTRNPRQTQPAKVGLDELVILSAKDRRSSMDSASPSISFSRSCTATSTKKKLRLERWPRVSKLSMRTVCCTRWSR